MAIFGHFWSATRRRDGSKEELQHVTFWLGETGWFLHIKYRQRNEKTDKGSQLPRILIKKVCSPGKYKQQGVELIAAKVNRNHKKNCGKWHALWHVRKWYFVTKIVLTYWENKLFLDWEKTFEFWGWRLTICKFWDH